MGLTQYYTAATIDGFIADEDNSLEWLFSAADEGGGRHEDRFGRFLADVTAMAMGATTYRWVLEHERVLDDPTRWTTWYADRPCWVFAHGEVPVVPGADIRVVQGDVGPVHAAMLAAAAGGNIWLVGGGELVGAFADQGLLDEIILSIAPVTLGAGAPVLPRRLTGRLSLAEPPVANGGFVELRYRVGGHGAS